MGELAKLPGPACQRKARGMGGLVAPRRDFFGGGDPASVCFGSKRTGHGPHWGYPNFATGNISGGACGLVLFWEPCVGWFKRDAKRTAIFKGPPKQVT